MYPPGLFSTDMSSRITKYDGSKASILLSEATRTFSLHELYTFWIFLILQNITKAFQVAQRFSLGKAAPSGRTRKISDSLKFYVSAH